MLLLLLTVPSLILFLVLYFTYKNIASYKNGLLFAVTLPPHALEHPQVQHIQKNYIKVFNRTSMGIIIAYLPILFINKYIELGVIYYLLWVIAAVTIYVIPHRKAFRATLALKRQEQWFVGEKKIIHADLRAAQLKNKRAASPQIFLIPLAVSILLTVWVGSNNQQFYGIGIAAVLTTLLFMSIVILLRRSRSTVFSDNSEVNIALNQHKRRLLTYLFFWLAILENLHFYLLSQFMLNESESMSNSWLYIVIGFSIIPVIVILLVYQRISSLRREMLSLEGNPVYSDDDEYWSNGFTYHNPYDKTILVPKRVGIGETINTGTLTGKIVIFGALGLFVAVIAWVSFLMIRSELTSPVLTINDDQAQINIDYPMYNYSFALEDIQELTLVDSIPSGIKSNGEATSKYARGHFRLKELGKSRLYVYKNNPPYIKFQLEEQYIFYNDIDASVTQQLYEQIRAQLEK